ncbi:hypothetical protein CASFOL_017850 [Castilleja foliolosa]|uniref:RING-type domain-containing protein n=1 Tax=Castilleja foliolosa TaxID=1961234 RepID=A0ABD3DB72_9LAMI
MSSSEESSDAEEAPFLTDELRSQFVLDAGKETIEIQNRLHIAAECILRLEFDRRDPNPGSVLLKKMENSAEILEYLTNGEKMRKQFMAAKFLIPQMREQFMAAKLMALRMIQMEDAIIKASPDGINQLSDEALMSIIQKEFQNIKDRSGREPEYQEGVVLTRQMISAALKSENYTPEPSASGDCDCCQICLKQFKEGNLLCGSKDCKHRFHSKCLMNWLTSHRLCPTCRVLVLPPIAEFPGWITDVAAVRLFLDRAI